MFNLKLKLRPTTNGVKMLLEKQSILSAMYTTRVLGTKPPFSKSKSRPLLRIELLTLRIAV